MTDEDDEPGKVLGQSDDAQLSLGGADLFIQCESELLSMRLRFGRGIQRIDRKHSLDLRDEPVMESFNEVSEPSRQEYLPQQDDPHNGRGQIDHEIGGHKIMFEQGKQPLHQHHPLLAA